MTKSKLLMTAKYSNIPSLTTSLARRTLLLISFLLLGLGNVWGQDNILWGPGSSSSFDISSTVIKEKFGTADQVTLRISCSKNDIYISTTEWQGIGGDGGWYRQGGEEWKEDHYEIELDNNMISLLKEKGMHVQGTTVTLIEYILPPPDTFEGSAKSSCKYDSNIRKRLTNADTSIKLDIVEAIELLDGEPPMYARFYVLHNGEPLDLSGKDGLLTIENVTPEKQSPKKGIYGYYLYNSGNELNLDNIKVKLNAEAGKFPEYQVICVLSTSQAREATENVVTEEPNWDVMFTYAFRNQVETKEQSGTVVWDAVAMTASVSAGNIAEEWQTTWSNLAQEQKIQWYVTDESEELQLLEIGTERKDGVWTINLPKPFAIEDNVAVMTGQSTYDATSFEAMWNIWSNPAIYAPADKGYIDLQNYKIVCIIADDAEATEPNVVYTLSISKTSFAGQEKTTTVKTTQQVKLEKDAKSANILENFSLPEGTKYARFYIVNQNGDIVNGNFWLTGNSFQEPKDGDALGWYIYDASDVSLTNVTINSNSANLDKYQVIMVTSKELADLNQYEPDYDTQTTFWFKYPLEDKDKWKPTAEVEWSPQSMQIIAPDIEEEKGEGYLSENRQHYTLQWTVEDKDGNPQPLCIGDSRIDDCWSVSILANPFTLDDDGKVLTVSDDTNLNTITWNNWTAPLFFAPKNKTKNQLAGTKFVCKFYEDDDSGDPAMLAMVYTIDMVRPELGLLKDEGLYKEEIIGEDDIEHTQTIFTFSLDHATDAFRTAFGKATYVRVYLAKNDGTALHPGEGEEQLEVAGGTLFTTNPEYGYYFSNENGVDLSEVMATLTLPDGMFTYYNVVVAMSADEADINNGSVYEPDYDYVYTFKFIETSTFPGSFVENLITHDKEVQIKSTDIEVQIPLNETATVNEFLRELGENSFGMNYFHVRWFVAKKNVDGTYEKLAESEKMLDVNNKEVQHKTRRNQGVYWNKGLVRDLWYFTQDDILKVKFTKPMDGNWSDYQVVVWMTNKDKDAVIDDETNTLSHEPDIKIQYIYSFVEEELEPPFVHYQGEAYRYLKEKGEDIAAQQRDYMTLDGDAWLQEYTWNIETETYEPISGNIRQNVHTWEYDIYVLPNEPRQLILPFQYYTTEGQNDEPRGYIRWYDWKTDTKVVGNNFTFTKEESKGASFLDENDRGFFALCKSTNLHQYNIGVNFTPDANFSESIDIACDVSKYSDGIVNVNGEYHLLHEPTLSNRYIFHIHPASEIADSLAAARQRLEEAIWKSTIDTKVLYEAMSTLREDKGKVVVSITKVAPESGTTNIDTEFSLRFDHHNLHNYMLRDGDGYAPAEEVKWYAYIENNGSISPPQLVSGIADDTKRIYTFKYSTFAGMGSGSIHVVGYAGKDGFSIENNTGVYAPVVHYELQFIEAPPVPLSNILSDLTDDKIKYKERMEGYMLTHYEVKGIVDFDGNPETNENIKKNPYEALYYYSTPNWYDKPSSSTNNSSVENISYVPFPWDDIQYGFCYPLLTETIMNGYSSFAHYVSPEHGDYTILKTMNVDSISNGSDYNLWFGNELYDYTYYATKSKEDTQPQYGSFLYTDASDESRSIATIPFTAELCSGSSFYFTAVVANLTDDDDKGIDYGGSRKISPQLLIRIVGIKEDGTRERIVAFHTGAFTSNITSRGKWYQVYGLSTVSKDFDTSITRFEAEVINYANGTWGADFAIDQIVIYTSTSKVLLTQTGDASCKPNEDEVEPDKVKAYMEADGLQSAFGISNELQPIYWRICDEDNGEVITGPGMYPRYDKDGNLTPDNGRFTYGVTWVKSNFSNSDLGITEEHPYGWYYDSTTEKYFFQIADKSFDALEEGKHYYVSVFDPTAGFEKINDDHFWGGLYFGAKNRCSIYSEFFVPRRQYVTYTYGKNGTEGGELTIACGGDGAKVEGIQMILKVPDSDEPTGYKNYTTFHYDFAYVSLKTWKSTDATFAYNDITYKYTDLSDALKDYRTTYVNEKIVNSDYSKVVGDVDYAEILKAAVSAGILELACSESFTHEFDQVGNYAITCIPVEKYINIGSDNPIEICAPFEVTFKLKSSGGPSLALGFEKVAYPENYMRVVRVGLEQINNMQKVDGYLLHIPVHSFKTEVDATENVGTLEVVGDLELLANTGSNKTDDNSVNNKVIVATFEGDKKISNNKMYISVNFHGKYTDESETELKPVYLQDFKEGFTYHMFFQIKNENADEGACTGNVEFLMKVVPEYVTWNDKGTEVTPNSNQNTNWNNDANWSRSKKEELYKTGTNNYNDNVEMGINSTPATFVPMKFTYVTIPSGNVAPKLINLETTNGIYNNIGEGATSNIQYDLMVKVENDCSHGITDNNVYDCEKFYGNWAKEIYFKPGAELLYQQYLTYKKAWVEKELKANTWTLMSTPLQNTYAGDMYVPVGGRQETEAFTDINFDNGYSRTLYPIYQKSWLQEDSKVYTKTNDVRANDYNAELKGSVSETLTLWSHTYNDVQVNYSQWKGFAIRAHKKEQKDTQGKDVFALLRLPKADTNYDYYKWDGTVPEENKVSHTVNKTTTGKLFTDGTENINNITYGVKYGDKDRTAGNGNVNIHIDEVQDNNDYLLIGNPYLCSINMEQFLTANSTILENKYWTYEHNEVASPYTKGTIEPLQSFFVKLNSTASEDAVITFTSAMMTDGNNQPAPEPAPAMTMTAVNERGQSSATLSVGEEAKSVETLFDSNLEDVPVVYTVADGQAVSIHQVTELNKPIAFGVTCAASDELVEVTFSDVAQLTNGDVYVVDAVTGEQTAVGEGSTLSLQPNDYGRYYLLAGTTDITDKVDMQKGILVSVRGREVTVTSSEELTQVHALSLTGATVYQDSARSTTTSFTLASGVYIIQAKNVVGEQQTVKVIVK